jgi:hypothetical protein
MTKVKEIERALENLPQQEDLAEFRSWHAVFDAAQWDAKLAKDVSAGRLDALADEALDPIGRLRTLVGPDEIVTFNPRLRENRPQG